MGGGKGIRSKGEGNGVRGEKREGGQGQIEGEKGWRLSVVKKLIR